MIREAFRGRAPGRILDLGTGTGDLIADLIRAGGRDFELNSLIGMDLSGPMLERAREKVGGRAWFFQADGAAIPLADGTADLVVSAFVLRNVKKIMGRVLAEVRRVLAPGGRVLLLEMYPPQNRMLRALHKVYLRSVLPAIGAAVFGPDWSGGYLPETILNFGSPAEFSGVLKEAGFQEVKFRALNGGIAVLHQAVK